MDETLGRDVQHSDTDNQTDVDTKVLVLVSVVVRILLFFPKHEG